MPQLGGAGNFPFRLYASWMLRGLLNSFQDMEFSDHWTFDRK